MGHPLIPTTHHPYYIKLLWNTWVMGGCTATVLQVLQWSFYKVRGGGRGGLGAVACCTYHGSSSWCAWWWWWFCSMLHLPLSHFIVRMGGGGAVACCTYHGPSSWCTLRRDLRWRSMRPTMPGTPATASRKMMRRIHIGLSVGQRQVCGVCGGGWGGGMGEQVVKYQHTAGCGSTLHRVNPVYINTL